MNKIITMVGTSIFENYRREKSDDAVSMGFFEDLKDIESEKWEDEIERCKRLKSCVNSWITKKINKELENISAEVKSLAKLSEELKDAFEIYLLSSDTILSRLAGEILKDVLPKLESFENAKIELRVIKGLQVKDRKKFNEGMSNLITEIYKIAGGSWDNVIINITGGYKATIPFLTILAQINRCLIYYIFEETDSLIQIPNIPLTEELFNWKELVNYKDMFEWLKKGITEKDEYQKLINSEFYKKYSYLVWTYEELAELNPIGDIIYEKLNEKFYTLYIHEDEWIKIEKDKRLAELLSRQFSNEKIRKEKTEIKNDHYVYDAGDNQLRIFFREKDEKIWIYKVFNNHDEYERYLKIVKYSDDIINLQLSKFVMKTLKKEV